MNKIPTRVSPFTANPYNSSLEHQSQMLKCLARNPDVKQKILENGILSGSRIVHGVEVWSL